MFSVSQRDKRAGFSLSSLSLKNDKSDRSRGCHLFPPSKKKKMTIAALFLSLPNDQNANHFPRFISNGKSKEEKENATGSLHCPFSQRIFLFRTPVMKKKFIFFLSLSFGGYRARVFDSAVHVVHHQVVTRATPFSSSLSLSFR